jgi:hypothetical protein
VEEEKFSMSISLSLSLAFFLSLSLCLSPSHAPKMKNEKKHPEQKNNTPALPTRIP